MNIRNAALPSGKKDSTVTEAGASLHPVDRFERGAEGVCDERLDRRDVADHEDGAALVLLDIRSRPPAPASPPRARTRRLRRGVQRAEPTSPVVGTARQISAKLIRSRVPNSISAMPAPPDQGRSKRSARISADSCVRRTGEPTTVSMLAGQRGEPVPVARACSRPSSSRPGRCPRVRRRRACPGVRGDAVTDQHQRGGRCHRAVPRCGRASADGGLPGSAPAPPQGCPAAPVAGRLRRRAPRWRAGRRARSARAGPRCTSCRPARAAWPRSASGLMSGCLIFQRPDICSTTSLESIRTSSSARARAREELEPGDQTAVLRDVVGRGADGTRRARRSPRRCRRLEHRAVRRRAGVAS